MDAISNKPGSVMCFGKDLCPAVDYNGLMMMSYFIYM